MCVGEEIIGKHGGYRRLKSYQVAQLVHDVTVRFCDRYIDRRSRTRDQMEQAARSGAQNIAEGSMVSGTSSKTEFKLTGVARASLEELRLDYKDFLRQRGLPEWAGDDARRAALIELRPASAEDVGGWVKTVCESRADYAAVFVRVGGGLWLMGGALFELLLGEAKWVWTEL